MIGLCCLALSVPSRPANAQGVSWARGAAADVSQVPAPVKWQRSVQVDQPKSGNSPPPVTVRLQAAAVAVVVEDTPGEPAIVPFVVSSPLASPSFNAVAQTPAPGARLGAPLEVPLLTGTADAVVPPLRVPEQGRPDASNETATASAVVAGQYVLPSRRERPDFFAEEGLLPITIQLTLPGPHRLFRLDSEADVMERIRQEARQVRPPEIIEFPEERRYEPWERVFVPRHWPLAKELVEPAYVSHGRLLFEQINSERYGWSMGVVQPAISALHFYADVATLPYHLAQDPCRYGDTSAGKCQPGDPVPLYLYPPQGSLSGLSAEAAAIVLLFCIFP